VGRRESASADGTVKVWDVEAGVAAFTLMEEAASVAFSPDGLTLGAGGDGPTVSGVADLSSQGHSVSNQTGGVS
jgi:WD40 repeat protein